VADGGKQFLQEFLRSGWPLVAPGSPKK
jgi:hypothetical protein